jgi:cardiolipin synthase (CMP-forming)
MTLANKITIGRILLIPVFVAFAIYYAESLRAGQPVEAYRWAAIGAFLVAAVSDGLDGFIARHFNQRSRLGRILDPFADKCLLLSAILTLSLTPWPWHFPLWFPILVIARDLLLIAGAILINHLAGKVEITPHWSGKVATFFQMCAVAWIMLQLEFAHPIWVTGLAGFFTALSSVVYLQGAVSQLRATSHSHPEDGAGST